MNIAIQLFARDGTLVDTVSIDKHAEIIICGLRYFALREGRYVESDAVFASSSLSQVINPATASRIVTTQVQMR